MNPEWKKLSMDAKLDRLHELIHAPIRQVDDIGAKVSRLHQQLRPAVGARGDRDMEGQDS
jgi:hypothetical protein